MQDKVRMQKKSEKRRRRCERSGYRLLVIEFPGDEEKGCRRCWFFVVFGALQDPPK